MKIYSKPHKIVQMPGQKCPGKIFSKKVLTEWKS